MRPAEDSSVRPGPVRAVIVTNIPAPYRIPVYEILDAASDVELRVVYLAERESNRHWRLPDSTVRSITLKSRVIRWRGRYIHLTRAAWRTVASARPDVVITTGFNPPQLVAIAYCVLRGVPHIVQTDGTLTSEANLSRLHHIVRLLVARRSASFVVASRGGRDLITSWGVPEIRIHQSPLAIDNGRFAPAEDQARDIDVLFSGQLAAVKDPLFALAVAEGAARRLGRRLTAVFLGAGPLEADLRAAAQTMSEHLAVIVPGFQQQSDLPAWFARARVFLFPSHWDPWGLVANEAAAAGVPVIASPHAGSSGELVVNDVNGYVEPLRLAVWVDRLVALLSDERLRGRQSEAALRAVTPYTFDSAAAGLRAAILEASR